MNSTSLVYCSSEMTQDLVYLIGPFTTLSYILAKEGVVKMNLIIILKKSVFITKINEKKWGNNHVYIYWMVYFSNFSFPLQTLSVLSINVKHFRCLDHVIIELKLPIPYCINTVQPLMLRKWSRNINDFSLRFLEPLEQLKSLTSKTVLCDNASVKRYVPKTIQISREHGTPLVYNLSLQWLTIFYLT